VVWEEGVTREVVREVVVREVVVREVAVLRSGTRSPLLAATRPLAATAAAAAAGHTYTHRHGLSLFWLALLPVCWLPVEPGQAGFALRLPHRPLLVCFLGLQWERGEARAGRGWGKARCAAVMLLWWCRLCEQSCRSASSLALFQSILAAPVNPTTLSPSPASSLLGLTSMRMRRRLTHVTLV